MSVLYMPREGWDEGNLPRLGHRVSPADRVEVFIHHTVTLDNDETRNTWETIPEVVAHMRRLQAVRSSDLGADVPYSLVAHCMASGDLLLAEGRGLYRTGSHTKGRNTAAIGVAFAGDFENHDAPSGLEGMLSDLGRWLSGLRKMGFVRLGLRVPSPTRQVWGHKDVKATACPGRHLVALLSSVRIE